MYSRFAERLASLAIVGFVHSGSAIHGWELTSLKVYLTRPLGRPAARVARCGCFGAGRLRSRPGCSAFSSACSFSANSLSVISTAVQHSPCFACRCACGLNTKASWLTSTADAAPAVLQPTTRVPLLGKQEKPRALQRPQLLIMLPSYTA